MTITINLPFAIYSLNQIRRRGFHYPTYRNLLEKYMMEHKRTTFAGPVRITITRSSSGTLDYDGLVGGAKPALDALVRSGIIEDDKPAIVGTPDYVQVKISRKVQPVTVIQITNEI
ncbi:hypothetical protein GCM10027299_09500 [Larkinella ripae]